MPGRAWLYLWRSLTIWIFFVVLASCKKLKNIRLEFYWFIFWLSIKACNDTSTHICLRPENPQYTARWIFAARTVCSKCVILISIVYFCSKSFSWSSHALSELLSELRARGGGYLLLSPRKKELLLLNYPINIKNMQQWVLLQCVHYQKQGRPCHSTPMQNIPPLLLFVHKIIAIILFWYFQHSIIDGGNEGRAGVGWCLSLLWKNLNSRGRYCS